MLHGQKIYMTEQETLVSDLKISDLRGNIYALEVHANILLTNNSGLTMLEKDTTFLFCSRDFTGM